MTSKPQGGEVKKTRIVWMTVFNLAISAAVMMAGPALAQNAASSSEQIEIAELGGAPAVLAGGKPVARLASPAGRLNRLYQMFRDNGWISTTKAYTS
jgi:hypothetical protein